MTKNIGRNFIGMILLISCLVCLTTTAWASSSISILPSVDTVGPGEEFTLSIYVKPDMQIAGLQLDLDYDSSLLTIESVDEGDLFANTGSPVMFNPGTTDNNEGTVSQIYGTLIMGDGTSDEGTFCTIGLTAAEDTGTCQLRIENIILGDKNGNELDVVTYDALVSIGDEISSSSNDNGKETDLNIIVKQDTEEESIQENDVQDPEVAEETILQSVPDTVEEADSQQTVSGPEAEKNTSNISMLAVVAIAFLAMAYILDRKRK